jgi:chromate transport protein ChrA
MALPRSFRSDLRRGVLMGAPVGYATGLALYGTIGYWAAGTTGLLVGCLAATVFAAIGLHLCLRYVEAITR